MQLDNEDDPLDFAVPAGIPGVLFNNLADELFKHYPASKRKAKRVTVKLLEVLMSHYEEVAAQENQ
jgi:hypothetical protein